MTKEKGHGPLERAEDRLKESKIWDQCREEGSIGRTWGARYKGNCCSMPGSQIAMSDGLVFMIVFSEGGKQHNSLLYNIFGSHPLSTLEERVVEVMAGAGLLINKIMSVEGGE